MFVVIFFDHFFGLSTSALPVLISVSVTLSMDIYVMVSFVKPRTIIPLAHTHTFLSFSLEEKDCCRSRGLSISLYDLLRALSLLVSHLFGRSRTLSYWK